MPWGMNLDYIPGITRQSETEAAAKETVEKEKSSQIPSSSKEWTNVVKKGKKPAGPLPPHSPPRWDVPLKKGVFPKKQAEREQKALQEEQQKRYTKELRPQQQMVSQVDQRIEQLQKQQKQQQ